ncbi:MAG: hypothetical protein ACD_15C00162G0007 [uncultured bacterium]|nr:MAG: hypothetical protein ACD_15C00162G0007 [uncultured bacterium]HCU70328.1 hypothetical protein [Candidatus Moranbacteria bacterium]
MRWKIRSEKSKFFTPPGIMLIFICLFLILSFVIFEKTGKIYQHYQKKNPPVANNKTLVFPKKYKIGFVSDAHAVANKKNVIRENAKIPMENFVSHMNNDFKPDFVVDGGDFIDGTRRFGEKSNNDFLVFNRIFQKIQAPKHQVLGNHELRGMTRENWIRKTGNKNSYYYSDYDEKLRIIVFDSTLITSSQSSKDPKKIAYEKELAWLEDVLKNSPDKKIIIFSHHPPVPNLRKETSLENIARLNKIFSNYHVRAVFSGHVEILYYENIGGVDYFVTPGFYRSENLGLAWFGSFSEIGIGLKNHLKLFYKEKGDESVEYKTIIIPSKEYYAMEKEEREKVNFLAPIENGPSSIEE